jgi:L-alanine-DL-glutamate epimerase-like enolase superfamily enzyme
MPWFSRLYTETLDLSEGQALVPERPGWGFTFNQDYIDHLALCD